MAVNVNDWWASRNWRVEGVAETHYRLRPLLKTTLQQSLLTDEVRAYLGQPFRDSFEQWQAMFGDRFFDMSTMIRLASAVDLGLAEYLMAKKGMSFGHMRALIKPHGTVFQRLNPGPPNDAVEFLRREINVDVSTVPHFGDMRLVMQYRHLYVHNQGVVDDKYIENIREISGVDIRPRFPGYPQEEFYDFAPLEEMGRYIESARSFFRHLLTMPS